MSDSRLEKFIYAICSMDVSDLPVPLSRIEKLWNCLITGETPDFEPLSRNEKYLMAMLDRYDISNLPAPMSRGEKLLYKIAVGETDLSDVPDYLSRYEELLKYLIENGGISGGDFEYVLYTLNQSLYTLYTTAEKPVKSAILKGRTLVNVNRSNYTTNTNITTDYGQAIEFYDADMLPNTTYTIIMYSDNPYECRFSQMYNDREYALSVVKVGTPFVFTTVGNYQGLRSYLKGDELNIPQGTEIKILIIEGDYTNIDIPYFEGMQSVKMPVLTTTGKNLFDGELEVGGLNSINGGNDDEQKDRTRTKSYIKVKPNTFYILSRTNYKGTWAVRYYDENYNHISPHLYNNLSEMEIKTGANVHYIRIVDLTNDLSNLYQIEEDKVATEYEPYKSNILTVNEDVTLRGIGEVKDELDLMTGEVVERVGEVVLNGSESWKTGLWKNQVEGIGFQVRIKNDVNSSVFVKAISDKILYNSSNIFQQDGEYFDMVGAGNGETWIRIRILRSKLSTEDVEGFKKWLSQNNVKILYELSDKPIKTVDLTVVDQDNQPTQLGTFENVTHVSLEAENLIPEVELEVVTRISEELASASPLMDDISTNQKQLEVTIDEQSENVDATMIATTEIYEETL